MPPRLQLDERIFRLSVIRVRQVHFIDVAVLNGAALHYLFQFKRLLKSLMPCLGAVVFISGCATDKGVPAREVEPGTEPASVSSPIPNNSAKILMRSAGMPMNVEYSVGPAELACKELEKVGVVRDKGNGVLLPWIVKLTEKLNRVPDQIETIVPAQVAVQVAAYGSWYDGTSKGHCGPVNMSFLTADKHTYLVEFVWRGTSACVSNVFDVTDPTARVAVPATPKICPRSFLDIWFGR